MSSIARRPSAKRSRCASSIPEAWGRSPLPRVAPFAVFIAFIAAQPLLEGAVEARALAIARGIAVAVMLAFFWRSYGELTQPAAPGRRASIDYLLAAAVGLGAFGAWIGLDSGWAVVGSGAGGFVPLDPSGRLDWSLAALRLFGLVLVVPIMEELFWRSFLMRWIDRRDFVGLDPRAASLAAFAISSALFAAEHTLWFAGLLAGIGYGWLYRRTGNLRVSIASHAITNATLGAWILATQNWSHW